VGSKENPLETVALHLRFCLGKKRRELDSAQQRSIIKKCLAEFFGTFALVFAQAPSPLTASAAVAHKPVVHESRH
jgi:hypothetical protein